MRDHLRDAHSHGKPQIANECGNCEVVKLLNELSNGTIAARGRKMQSQELDLRNGTIRRSL